MTDFEQATFLRVAKGQAKYQIGNETVNGSARDAVGLVEGQRVAVQRNEKKVVAVSTDVDALHETGRATAGTPVVASTNRPTAGRVSGTRPARHTPRATNPNGFINPYTFVPLPGVDPQRRSPEPHHRFTGLSGVLEVELDALTDLFTSDGRPETGAGATQLSPMRIGDRYVINATTLKGLIRSTAELISGSCLRIVAADRRFSHRPPVESGSASDALKHAYRVVSIEPDRLTVLPMQRAKLPIRDSRGEWVNDLSDCADGDEVTVTVTGREPNRRADLSRTGQTVWLKLADVRGEDPPTVKGRRNNQTVVWVAKNTLSQVVSGAAQLIADYNRAIEASIAEDERQVGDDEYVWCASTHETSRNAGKVERWGKRRKRHPLEVGDIIYGDTDEADRLERIGPSQITRHAYRHGSGDAIPAGFQPCNDPERLCWACRVFGMTPDERDNTAGGVAGHVRIGTAETVGAVNPLVKHQLPVLSSPKPAHGSFYLLANGNGGGSTWDGDSIEIAGRKLYWHRKTVARRVDGESVEQAADVRALPAETRFRFTVRFDNLDAADLGLLLCAIDPRRLGDGFGAAAHKIGMGRPVGLGSVRLTVTASSGIDRRTRYRGIDDADSPLDEPAAVQALLDALKAHYGAPADELPHLRAFAAAANFDATGTDAVRYPPGPDGREHESFQWFKEHRDEALLWPEQVTGGDRQAPYTARRTDRNPTAPRNPPPRRSR